MPFYTLPADHKDRAKLLRKSGLQVTMPDGSAYLIKTLLTHQAANAKLAKSGKADEGYYTVGLSLAPHMSAGMGNICPSASPACIEGCLNTAGKGVFNAVQRARIAKTRAALGKDTKDGFISMLVGELDHVQRKATQAGLKLAVRLNILSDLRWEKLAPWLFTRYPDVMFYDYTKLYARLGQTPANYDLTFSRSETNDVEVKMALDRRYRVAVVFSNRSALPATWEGTAVVDADKHDLRFLEPAGVICGLTAKGKMRGKAMGGFVVHQA